MIISSDSSYDAAAALLSTFSFSLIRSGLLDHVLIDYFCALPRWLLHRLSQGARAQTGTLILCVSLLVGGGWLAGRSWLGFAGDC